MTEVEIFKESLDVSRIVMLITILMAVTSVVFSALTMAFERSHNKRSIRPFCNLIASIEGNTTFVSIRNAGMGTMILKSISLVDESFNEFNIADIKTKYPNFIFDLLQINNELAISINEKLNILSMNDSIHEEAIKVIKECRIIIKYSDMYNQDFKKDLKIKEITSCALTIASTMTTRPVTQSASLNP